MSVVATLRVTCTIAPLQAHALLFTATMRIAIVVLLAGCAGDGSISNNAQTAREKYDTAAWPALGQCVGCHGAQPTIDFLAPGTADGAYTTVFAFQPPIVDLDAPAASLLLTQGKHTGPALDPISASVLLDWLTAEATERATPPVPPVVIGPIQPALATPVAIDLPAGGKLRLRVDALAGTSGLAISGLEFDAGASGLHVAHPLFVSHPAGAPAIADTLDRFDELDTTLAAGASDVLGDELFLAFAPGDPLTIHFTTLEAP